MVVLTLAVGGCGGQPVPARAEATAAAPTSTAVSRSAVPDLTGMTGSAAAAALRAARFGDVRFAANGAAMSSPVVGQHPAPGSSWDTTEPVFVALAPVTVAVAPPATAPAPVATAPPTTPPPPAPAPAGWTYRVSGAERASITWSAEGGNTSQDSEADLPWSTSVQDPGFSGMTFAYVSAQNLGSGTISCAIVAPSGAVVSENSSEGPYAIVTCQNS